MKTNLTYHITMNNCSFDTFPGQVQALVTSPSIRAFFHPRISLGTWVTLGEERFAGCHVRGNFSWRLPLFAWKQLRDKKEANGRGSYGLVCATFYAATKTHGDGWATRSSVFVQNLCNMPWHPFRVLGFGSFSAVPCFRIWGHFPPHRYSAIPPFRLLGSPVVFLCTILSQ